MSQTSAPSPARSFGPPVSDPGLGRTQGTVTATGSALPAETVVPERSGRWSDTPGRMQLAAITAVIASLIFSLLGGWAYREWSSAMDSARANTEQLVRIQGIQNDLVQADAAAATAYLNGGNESEKAKGVYDASISSASKALAEPVSSTADSQVLATALDGLSRYTGLVERARANNRQGLQIGAAYQRQAGEVLRQEIIPALQKVAAADEQRVADAYSRANRATVLLIVALTLSLAALVGVQVWLARRTHRILNIPLVIGTVAVIAAAVLGLISVGTTASVANDTARGNYAAAVSLAQARTAAFDAKAREAFGLINRGNATADETRASADIASARTNLASVTKLDSPTSEQAFSAWVSEHDKVRAADDAGNWVGARDLAIGSSSTAFMSFAAASGKQLDALTVAVSNDLGRNSTLLLLSAIATVLAGLIAALTAWAGVSRRLGEYR